MLALLAKSNHPYPSLISSSYLRLAQFLGSLIVLRLHNWSLLFGKSNVLDSAKLFWQICNLLSCVFNGILESATQREHCYIIVSDHFLSWGSTTALSYFQPQKSASQMGRGRKRHQKSRNGVDESDPTQTGQEEEIGSPSPHTSPRRGINEEKEGMNQRDLS